MNVFSANDNAASLGEKKLISRICQKFGACMPPPPFGAGDDCAVIEKSTLKNRLCLTSDAVILGRHFLPTTPARDAAKKLINRNVSDIASMGARPAYALTSGVFSKKLSLKWLDFFCEGLAEAAQKYGIRLIGGDIAAVDFDYFSMHLTLVGETDGNCLLRSGAREGDFLYVSGPLGLSFESGKHLHFEPRLEEGAWLACRAEVGACTDLSDGLGSDILNIVPQGCCAEIDCAPLPLFVFGGKTASVKNALFDGEDYELLFSVRECEAANFESAYAARFAIKPFRIGRIKKALSQKEENALVLVEGSTRRVCDGRGFDHMF